jgi:hypothetical protein
MGTAIRAVAASAVRGFAAKPPEVTASQMPARLMPPMAIAHPAAAAVVVAAKSRVQLPDHPESSRKCHGCID